MKDGKKASIATKHTLKHQWWLGEKAIKQITESTVAALQKNYVMTNPVLAQPCTTHKTAQNCNFQLCQGI